MTAAENPEENPIFGLRAYISGMEQYEKPKTENAAVSDLLRQYRIYNPSLLIAPMHPGTDRLVPVDPEGLYHRAKEWQADQWPKGANVAISTGARNHLIVVAVRSDKALKSFFALATDESGDLTPYMVRTPDEIHCYYRTRYDRTSAPASTGMSGIEVFGEGRYVPGAGSVVSDWQCKTMLDTTLEIPNIPELPLHMADALGLADISEHPSFSSRLRMR